ncbi:MAG TPA: YebC/PmpR family DNA-binding transcriptional regulator [Chitinophagales bacterium]|nr:YebC/PmpR family DNA-binding transcriptional regulator [Chitinophagales bacterium]
MGRIFEKRKHKMFARYDRMAKAFTRIGKEIAIAVKQGGPNPDYNPRLRLAIQNAKGANMPKDRVEAAIKRASSKDEKDYQEITYEGYGPHGVAIVVETATDNPTRTVANIRMYFNKYNGSLGKTGSLDFLFERKGVFKVAKGDFNIEELELELIDHGLEDLAVDENEIYIYTAFADFGKMSKALEERKLNVISAEKQRIPNSYVEVPESQQDIVIQLIESLEQDDDVQHVYHNMK